MSGNDHAESVLGFLASDGERLQCHECGEWYINLATHVRGAHDLDAVDYRAAWGLSPHVRMIGDRHRTTARAQALQRVAAVDGPFRGFAPVSVDSRSMPEFEEKARVLWTERLAAAGWQSWQDAMAWADEQGASWRMIGERIGVSGAFARQAALSEGIDVHLPRVWDKMIEAATDHVAVHGSLLGATGDLAEWVANARSDARRGIQGRAFGELDALDPGWRRPQADRLAQARAQGVTLRSTKRMASDRFWKTRLNEAGYADWNELLIWATVNSAGLSEISTQLGFNAKGMFDVLAAAAGADDPFAATAPFRSSRPGHLADDGSRVQCHDCGLWYGDLKQHVRRHVDSTGAKYTVHTYRQAHRLGVDTRLAPVERLKKTVLRDVWSQRFADAGVESWEQLLVWAAQTHVGVDEIGTRVGVRGSNVLSALRNHIQGDMYAATQPYRLSQKGHLEDDGHRVQCHDCGLWYRRLAPQHIKMHSDGKGQSYTISSYRDTHGLPARMRLMSQG